MTRGDGRRDKREKRDGGGGWGSKGSKSQLSVFYKEDGKTGNSRRVRQMVK